MPGLPRFLFRLPALILLSIELQACAPPPLARTLAVLEALEGGEPPGGLIAPNYQDALGDRQTLLADLSALAEACPRRTFKASELGATDQGEGSVEVVGRLEAVLTGRVAWTLVGPLALTLERSGSRRVQSGLLTDLRDVRRLTEARRGALEANDADAYGRLLHPEYRDGPRDRDATREKLTQDLGQLAIRLEPQAYRLTMLGPRARLEEDYVLVVQGRTLAPATARFELQRSEGHWLFRSGLYPAPSGEDAHRTDAP